MATQILMPALSPTMTEGTITKWLKAEGDTVSSGDVLAEIETDKATMELEAVEEGILVKIIQPEGSEGIPVNRPIAVMLEEGEDASAADAVATEALAGPDSILGTATAPAPETTAAFFGAAAMQLKTFLHARKFLDTDPTPSVHPPNVPFLADRRDPTPLARS